MTPVDAAALLGLDVDASIPDIQHAYLRQARRIHPDVLSGATEDELRAAGDSFCRLRDAREVMLAQKPVIPVVILPPDPQRAINRRRRGIGGSILILVALAIALVVFQSLHDGFLTQTVNEYRQQESPQVTETP